MRARAIDLAACAAVLVSQAFVPLQHAGHWLSLRGLALRHFGYRCEAGFLARARRLATSAARTRGAAE